MKIIHLADLHIGSKFLKVSDENKRKELISSLNDSFKRVVEYANKNQINTILLSGDVFDKDAVNKGDKEFFYSIIKANPSISFYYLKGNHDIRSHYVEGIDNLYTFNSEGKPKSYLIKDNHVLITGYEMKDNDAALYDMPPLTKDHFNILLLHGDITKKSGKDSINLDKLKDKNIDYLALGHIHQREEGKVGIHTDYVYPGCLMGRGFDEGGEKGFYVLDTDKKSFAFQPLKNRVFLIKRIDVSLIQDTYSLMKKIHAEIPGDKDVLLQVVLKGTLSFELNLVQLQADLNQRFYFVDIKNETKMSITQYDEIDEKSLKGMFIKSIKEDDTLDDSMKEEILRYGLSKINKEEA